MLRWARPFFRRRPAPWRFRGWPPGRHCACQAPLQLSRQPAACLLGQPQWQPSSGSCSSSTPPAGASPDATADCREDGEDRRGGAAERAIRAGRPRHACRCASSASQRASRPAAVSPRHCGQSISCRCASSWRTMSRSPARPNCTTRSSTASSRSARRRRSSAVDQLVEERVGLRLVEDAEAGIDAGLHGVRPQQRPAEGVDRADPRRVELADQAEPMIDLRLGGVQEPLQQAARMRSRISAPPAR